MLTLKCILETLRIWIAGAVYSRVLEVVVAK